MNERVSERARATVTCQSPRKRIVSTLRVSTSLKSGIVWGRAKSLDGLYNRCALFCSSEMGVEQSIHLQQRRMQASPVNALFERALLDALLEAAEESSAPSEQIEHAWDPGDCSPKFRVLRDRLTARRLPSPLTTDGIRGNDM